MLTTIRATDQFYYEKRRVIEELRSVRTMEQTEEKIVDSNIFQQTQQQQQQQQPHWIKISEEIYSDNDDDNEDMIRISRSATTSVDFSETPIMIEMKHYEEEKTTEEHEHHHHHHHQNIHIRNGEETILTSLRRLQNNDEYFNFFSALPFHNDHAPFENCPKKHGLREFVTHRSNNICHDCGVPVPRATVMYGCRTCDFYLCGGCVSTETTCIISDGRRCPNDHGLIENRWPENRMCDLCRKRVESGMKMLSCIICDYDECPRCCGFPEISYYDVLGISKTATEEDIRRAAWNLSCEYRKSSVKNPMKYFKRLESIALFNETATAFAILIDEDRRKQYDEYLELRKEHDDIFFSPHEGTEQENAPGIPYAPLEDASKILHPPGWKRKVNSKPSLSHGAYVAVAGTFYAPVAAFAYGAYTIGDGVVQGAKAVGNGLYLGGSGFYFGVEELRTGKKSPQRCRKIHINEHVRAWYTSQRVKPWRNVRKIVTEPLHGLFIGGTVIVATSVGGVCCGVTGAVYGVASNIKLGHREMKEAWIARRNSRKQSKKN